MLYFGGQLHLDPYRYPYCGLVARCILYLVFASQIDFHVSISRWDDDIYIFILHKKLLKIKNETLLHSIRFKKQQLYKSSVDTEG